MSESAGKSNVIVALLQIASLEYEFFDGSGDKIAITTGSELENLLKARHGAGWSATENNTLRINKPRFIGYRMAQLNEVSYGNVKSLGQKGMYKIELIDIPAEELRRLSRWI